MRWPQTLKTWLHNRFPGFIKPKKILEEVCVFPLPNTVLLPGTVLPLHIFEDRYKLMTDELLDHPDKLLAMSLEVPGKKGKAQAQMICGAGRVNLMHKFADGRRDIFVEGIKRLKIVDYIQKSPFIKAMAEAVPDVPFSSLTEERKFFQEISHLAKRWVFLSPDFQDQFVEYVNFFSQPHVLADFIGFHFLPTTEAKQKLLETVEQKRRTEIIIAFLREQVEKLEHADLSTTVADKLSGQVYH